MYILKSLCVNFLQAIIPSTEEASFLANCFVTRKFKTFVENGITVEGTCYNFLGADYNQYKTVLGSKEACGAITLHCSKTGK